MFAVKESSVMRLAVCVNVDVIHAKSVYPIKVLLFH